MEQPHTPSIRTLAVFGSTGSIGVNTLDVVRAHRDRFRVSVLACRSSIETLEAQIIEFQPDVAVVAGVSATSPEFLALRERVRDAGSRTDLRAGEAALIETAQQADYDIMMAAITGASGLPSVLACVGRGRDLALANKEALVVAGPLLTQRAAATGSRLLPVDSEHSAVWQCLKGLDASGVERVTLTASGGPFRQHTPEELRQVSVADALRHPTWQMGPKITVDSATLMNKALELVEAHWLFGLPADRLDAVIHHQSLIHAFVEFSDGSIIAQLGAADMRVPIQVALLWPERTPGPGKRLGLHDLTSLTFEPIRLERFPCFAFGHAVIEAGGNAGAIVNAANEVAVEAFLQGKLPFYRIAEVVRTVFDKSNVRSVHELSDLMASDQAARKSAAHAIFG